MKVLEISDRGIILKDRDEVLDNLIYEDEKDIVFEIYNLFSKYENIGEIEILCKISLSQDELENIESIIENNNGIVIRKGKNRKNQNFLIVGIASLILFQIILILFLFFQEKDLKKKEKIVSKILLKKEGELFRIRDSINKIESPLETNELFSKEKVFEKYLSLVISLEGNRLFLKKISMDRNYLLIEGYCEKILELVNFENRLRSKDSFKNLKFDYIENRRGVIYFLIELEIN